MDSIHNILSLSEQYLQALPEAPGEFSPPGMDALAGRVEWALLKPEATLMEVKALCDDARQVKPAAICVNPGYISLASGLLANAGVPVSAAIAYPLGASLPAMKIIEALICLSNGASEIDMVLNIGALKGEAYGQVLNEMISVAQVVHNQRAEVTMTLESGLLTRREKIIACLLSKAAGADYVKTQTGFGQAEALIEDVNLFARVAGPEVKVKAFGCIDEPQTAIELMAVGAARIVSSQGLKLLQDAFK